MKSKRASTLVLVGAVGLAGLGVGATLGPTAATAATSATSPSASSTATPAPQADRTTAIKDALAGLVKDGKITQAQADEVASTLATALPRGGFGHGGHDGLGGFGGFGGFGGGGLDTAAGVIGVTTDQLRTALENGQTLAQVAQGKGIDQSTLVSKLVAAAKDRIAAAVKAGQLTQARADSITADLQTDVTQMVTSTRPAGGRDHHGDDGDDAPATPSASPSASATS